jgi:hypothetical protein
MTRCRATTFPRSRPREDSSVRISGSSSYPVISAGRTGPVCPVAPSLAGGLRVLSPDGDSSTPENLPGVFGRESEADVVRCWPSRARGFPFWDQDLLWAEASFPGKALLSDGPSSPDSVLLPRKEGERSAADPPDRPPVEERFIAPRPGRPLPGERPAAPCPPDFPSPGERSPIDPEDRLSSDGRPSFPPRGDDGRPCSLRPGFSGRCPEPRGRRGCLCEGDTSSVLSTFVMVTRPVPGLMSHHQGSALSLRFDRTGTEQKVRQTTMATTLEWSPS